MSKQIVLLTGTAGFILGNFVRQSIYEDHPYELYSVDKIANSSLLNNIYQHKMHEFYPADICDMHIMNRLFEYIRPDIVINGAAESSVDKSIQDPNIFIHSNILGTQNLINLSLKYNVKKFVQISTDEVSSVLPNKDAPKVSDDAPLNPQNPYAASKAAAELLVKAAHNTHGLQYIITRSCNNYGMRQTPDKLIPRVIKHIVEDKPIPVYGKGLQMRDWISCVDNCSAILTILAKGKMNETYNISADQEMTNIEVVNKIIKIMGKGEIQFVEDRKGHDFRYGIKADKLNALGWKPRYKTFDDGIVPTIEWYKDNRYFLNIKV